jgi:ABC-type glycerol-3-phosphate transport system substrate-binding protein
MVQQIVKAGIIRGMISERIRPLRLLGVLLLIAALLPACANISPPPPAATPLRVAASPAPTTSPAPSPTPEGPLALRVWLPPQLDPAANTPAGRLLRQRLDEYATRRGVVVEVRIKALDGAGGLLDSLTTASAAAPEALPDLAALPRHLLEAAALKGLLHPHDQLDQAIQQTDWFDHARQLAGVQNTTFGLPFASDALLLVYRPSVETPQPPQSLDELAARQQPLIFPAADPQALAMLAFYQAAGGRVQDAQGRPALDAAALEKALAYFEDPALAPDWLAQIGGDEQAWQAFSAGQAPQAVTWASRYLSQPLTGTQAAALPTPGGELFTLSTGWVWALGSNQPQRQQAAADLAEFLCDSRFLAAWTDALGYLPPRPSALNGWREAEAQALAARLGASARLLPSADLLSSLGPTLQEAVLLVMRRQASAAAAAQQAAARLQAP